MKWLRFSRRGSQDTPQPKTRQIWGQDFAVVKDGLAEDQVAAFVNDLIARQRAQAQQQESRQSFPNLMAKRILAEAERDAATARLRARKEAESEAASIISQARQEADRILGHVKQEAVASAEQQAQSIIASASQKAHLAETHALQIAHLFLIRAKEEVQSMIASETKEVYQRLLKALQDLQSTAHSVESDWLSKKIEPRWGKPEELKEYQSTLLDALLAGDMDMEADAAGNAMMPQDMGSLETGLFTGVGPSAGESAPATEVAKPRPAPQVVEPVAGAASAPPAFSVEGALEEITTGVAPGAVAQPAPAQDAAVESVAANLVPGERLFQGEVDLSIAPPINAAKVTALYSHLQSIPEMKVVRTSGSWDRGTVVTVALDKPLPLLTLLSSLPALKVSASASAGGPLSGIGDKGKSRQRLNITFSPDEPGAETPPASM